MAVRESSCLRAGGSAGISVAAAAALSRLCPGHRVSVSGVPVVCGAQADESITVDEIHLMDLRATLQQTFGSHYTIERELGGGGMSRVFVARENALDRMVVVKVLPEELGGQVSTDRFK